MEENNIAWTVEPKPDFQDMSPVQQLNEIKPKYDFEKAALTLQNSKGLITNLTWVLRFLKSDVEYFVFSSINGATETFFVEILKDWKNLLSNMLHVDCQAICKDIYDCLQANSDKFEVYFGFRHQEDNGEMTLIYYKNYKLTSPPMDTFVAKKVKQQKAPKNLGRKMTKREKQIMRFQDKIKFLTKDFLKTSLQKVLYFIRDSTQATIVFEDLDFGESQFVKSISMHSWRNKVSVLENDCKRLMEAIINDLKTKKNWTMSISEGKVKNTSLRDVKFEKKPNFSENTFRKPNALDILGADVLNKQPLSKNTKLMIDMSTPVVCDNALRIMKGMGWDGGALGIRGNGITEPIMPHIKQVSRSGLGHSTDIKSQVDTKRHIGQISQTSNLSEMNLIGQTRKISETNQLGQTSETNQLGQISKRSVTNPLGQISGINQLCHIGPTYQIGQIIHLGQLLLANQIAQPSRKGQKKKKKYVPSNFLIMLLEKVVGLITKDDEEVILSLQNDSLPNKERSYMCEMFNKLNKRDESVIGNYGDKYFLMKILDVMIEDPSLRLVANVTVDKKIIISKAKNLPGIPTYIPGSDIREYIDTILKNCGPVFVDSSRLKQFNTHEFISFLMDLVLNDCESKTYISPTCFTAKDMQVVMTAVKSINTRSEYGSGRVWQFLYKQVLENVKGYFLDVEFGYVRSQHMPEMNQTNPKNSFTVKKVDNKQMGLYLNSKQNTKVNEEIKMIDEETVENITHDDAIDDDYFSTSDEKTSVDDSIDEYFDDDDMYETIDIATPVTEEPGQTALPYKDSNTINNDDSLKNVNDKPLSGLNALNDDDVDMKSLDSCNVSLCFDDTSTPNKADTDKVLDEHNNILLNIDEYGGNEKNTEVFNDEEPLKHYISNSRNIDKDSTDKEAQRKLPITTDHVEYINQLSNSVIKDISPSYDLNEASTSKVNLENAELDCIHISDSELTDNDNTDVSLNIDSNCANENVKNNSPDEWDQLEHDIDNLRQVLENELMNSLLNKAENEDHGENLKRYKADFDKFDTNKDSSVRTIKIVPLNYPNESIDKKTVSKIHNLIMEAISETEQPLLKCHGVKSNGLVYTCYTENSYKFLNKLLINTKTKILDESIKERKPRLFMRYTNYLDLSFDQIFSKIEIYNKNIRTKEWEVERNWDDNHVSMLALQMDEESFDIIKSNGFCLFFGVDQAEFSVVWG